MINDLKYLFEEQEVYDLAEHILKSNKRRLITDIAISKIPYVSYPDCSANQSLIIHELAEYLLKTAKNNNDSNELSITLDLSEKHNIEDGILSILQKTGICYGTKYDTDIFADPLSMHLIRAAKGITVINMHNHPSCSSFSTTDLSFFLRESTIKMMVVVGNSGELYYLSKDKNYNHDKARKYLTDAAYIIKPDILEYQNVSMLELRQIADLFLKNCYKFGIDYEHVLGSNKELQNIKENINISDIESEEEEYDR